MAFKRRWLGEFKDNVNIVSFMHGRETNGVHYPSALITARMEHCLGLPSKDLVGHSGCVNAVEFDPQGQILVTGGDSGKLLVWNLLKTIGNEKECKGSFEMKGIHESNIFCIGIVNDGQKVYSGGNDCSLLSHDLNTKETIDVINHGEPINSIGIHPNDKNICCVAAEKSQLFMIDSRHEGRDPTMKFGHKRETFHSVCYNPREPLFLLSSNNKYGIELWDIRNNRVPILEYGKMCAKAKYSAMSATFNENGTKIFGLRRHYPPILFNINSIQPIAEFDNLGYFNHVTNKSCSFAGMNDEYVMSGSDDFCIHIWKVPNEKPDHKEPIVVDKAKLVLRGHKSIVNQTRFSKTSGYFASSGVENIVKLWSTLGLPGTTSEDFDTEGENVDRLIKSGRRHFSSALDFTLSDHHRVLQLFDRLQLDTSDLLSSDEDDIDNELFFGADPEITIYEMIERKRLFMKKVYKKKKQKFPTDPSFVKNKIKTAKRILALGDESQFFDLDVEQSSETSDNNELASTSSDINSSTSTSSSSSASTCSTFTTYGSSDSDIGSSSPVYDLSDSSDINDTYNFSSDD